MSWKDILKSDYQEVPFDAYAGEGEFDYLLQPDLWFVTGFDDGSIEVSDGHDRVRIDDLNSNWRNTPPEQIEKETKEKILNYVDETKEDIKWDIDRNNLRISYNISWMEGTLDENWTIKEWLAELNPLDELEQKNN